MTTNKKTSELNQQKTLRLWPGIVIVILQWLIRFVIPSIVPEALVFGVFGGLLGGLAILVWWAFFSRAPKIERWGGIVLMIVTLFVTSLFLDVSIATGGQGMMFIIFAIPVLSLAFVAWAVTSQHLSIRVRHLTMVATIIIACGVWILLRIDGITGDFNIDLAWRWAETSEERLLKQDDSEPMDLISAPLVIDKIAEWPGFRGPNRDGIIKGIRIETDWSTTPPKELWRKPIGPGCSSFAVSSDLLYTQEQRGDDEIVACYNMNTGELLWRHNDKARFWDSHAGAGPRSTPTLSDRRVYTLGATGILNVLDASNGSLIWSRNAVSDADVKHSGWGYTSSPLVVDEIVVVAIVGKLVAYDIDTGDPRWFGPDGGDSYSSPHLMTIDGIKQILLMSESGATSITPAEGTLLWEYPWSGGSRIVQPAMTANGDLLISSGEGTGMRCINVMHESSGWTIEELWTSVQLKPNFNDFVVHKGYAYGYNGPSLVCIDVKDGKRMWKGGRYGGQLILLADQDLLLVLSERGELALVNANSDKFMELARLDAIEGKTWNHPVLVGDILLARNSEEMVAYQLSPAGS